ncbi:MAG: Rv1355c family protein [bacterium]|nr:Rv1355c family protein [bacterium]
MGISPKIIKNTYLINNTEYAINPVLFKPFIESEWNALQTLKQQTPGIVINDAILGQAKELIKAQNPKEKLKGEQLHNLAIKWLGDTPEKKGLWAYYPWKNTVVHILDEPDFIFLRTNRNHYKITPEEQDFLTTKTIGIIGLSVGHSIAVTIASERICSEIRLADFDIIELSNLNRIKTSLVNLDIPKVIVTAREISEIDPFITITIEPRGITKENITDFLSHPHNIDVLIEECDSIDIKFLARYEARKLKIPVVMDTSDRGLMDIERFDLEPNRPVFHGLISELAPDYIKSLSTEEKIPHVLQIIGKDTISKRMKASLVEVEETTTTWPQLSSGVTIGGGITTDITRRLLLNEFTESGRYFVDVADSVANKNEKPTLHSESIAFNTTITHSFNPEQAAEITKNYNDSHHQNRCHIKTDTAQTIIHHAIQAPSGGNCQPWQWGIENNIIFLFHDDSRSKSLLDYNNFASYLALGAAIENASLYCKNNGLEPTIHFESESEYPLVATLSVNQTTIAPTELERTLFENMFNRHTNRLTVPSEPIDEAELTSLRNWISPKTKLALITKSDSINEIADIVAEGERLRLLDPQSHKDLMAEIRWNEKEATETRTGIDLETFQLSASDLAGLEVVSDYDATQFLKQWGKGKGLKKLTQNGIKAAPAIGCLSIAKEPSSYTYFNGGRELQRLWIGANANGIALQPIAPLLYLFPRSNDHTDTDLSAFMRHELSALHTRFNTVFEKNSKKTDILLFRLFKSKESPKKSLRIEKNNVILSNTGYVTMKPNPL